MIEKPQKEVPLLLTISLFLCKKIGVPMLTFDIALFVSCSLSSLSFFSFLEEPWILQRSERRYEIRTQKSTSIKTKYEKLVRENQEQQESSMVSIAVGTRSLLFFFCFLSCGVKRKSATRGGVCYEHTSNTLASSSRPCLSAALGAEMTHLILTLVNQRCTKIDKGNQKSRNQSFHIF